MIKKGAFIFSLFVSLHSLFGQSNGYISLNVGLNGGRTTWGSFARYATDYNRVFYTDLKSKLGQMRWAGGYNFGATFVATNSSDGGVYLDLENETKFARSSAKFIDPSLGTRVYSVRYTSNTYTFGYATAIEDVIVTTGIFLGATNFYFEGYKRYGDGLISYGMENGSNTKYRFRRFNTGLAINLDFILNRYFAFYAGLKLGFTLPGSEEIVLDLPDYQSPFNSITRSGMLKCGVKFLIGNTY